MTNRNVYLASIVVLGYSKVSISNFFIITGVAEDGHFCHPGPGQAAFCTRLEIIRDVMIFLRVPVLSGKHSRLGVCHYRVSIGNTNSPRYVVELRLITVDVGVA